MKTKTCLELSQKYLSQGYTMRSTVNPELIPALRRWNKDTAKAVNEAIKTGNVKAAIEALQGAKGRNRYIKDRSLNHDKVIYNAAGEAVAWWDHKKQKAYELERDAQEPASPKEAV